MNTTPPQKKRKRTLESPPAEKTWCDRTLQRKRAIRRALEEDIQREARELQVLLRTLLEYNLLEEARELQTLLHGSLDYTQRLVRGEDEQGHE